MLAGEVVLPGGEVRRAVVGADDIAAVAAAVLTEDGHTGRTYELTGPRLLTFAEAVAAIADATGRDIRFARLGDAYAAGLATMTCRRRHLAAALPVR